MPPGNHEFIIGPRAFDIRPGFLVSHFGWGSGYANDMIKQSGAVELLFEVAVFGLFRKVASLGSSR